jgi:hypothetical protein
MAAAIITLENLYLSVPFKDKDEATKIRCYLGS